MAHSFIRSENLDDLARDLGLGRYAGRKTAEPEPAARTAVRSEFFVEETDERYVLQNVMKLGKLYTIEWTKGLLDNGASRTQQEWMELTKTKEEKLASAVDYTASLIALFKNKDHHDPAQQNLIGRMREMFRQDFDPRKPYLQTSTRVQYNTSGMDVVWHDWRYSTQTEKHIDMVGPGGFININSGFGSIVDALVGTPNLLDVEEAYEWASGKKPYLWRINSRPAQAVERAVVLGVSNGNGWFIIDASDVIGNHGPARGVVVSTGR